MSKTKVIDGIRYHADRPDSCRSCYFYKNRKIGCMRCMMLSCLEMIPRISMITTRE